jgi:hypothetical protein
MLRRQLRSSCVAPASMAFPMTLAASSLKALRHSFLFLFVAAMSSRPVTALACKCGDERGEASQVVEARVNRTLTARSTARGRLMAIGIEVTVLKTIKGDQHPDARLPIALLTDCAWEAKTFEVGSIWRFPLWKHQSSHHEPVTFQFELSKCGPEPQLISPSP